ncbi:hypothetical protein [Streptomyces sp. NPDC007100]|uniref:hypothetical protein n=1 Tax=Streptomyces sp. NPDC007100 TaxID=3155602 RepID=UPI0033D492B0
MASDGSGFKPTQIQVPKTQESDGKKSSSGDDREASHEIGQSRPQFTKQRLNELKQMVQNADPKTVAEVAHGWKQVRVSLVGEDWNSGIKKQFDDAVTKVLQSWHGASADAFAKAAQKISDNFAACAPYPHITGHVMEQISERLKTVQELVDGVEEPSWLERKADRIGDFAQSGTGKAAAVGSIVPGGGAIVAGIGAKVFGAGDGRDDSGLNTALANPKNSIFDAMNANRTNLSIDRERELEAAHYMEQLATVYRVGSATLANGTPRVGGDKDRIEHPDPGVGGGPLPGIGGFGPTPSAPKPGTGGAKVPGIKGGGYQTPTPLEPPRPKGIGGGIGTMPTPKPMPNVNTGLDGLGGGKGLGTPGGPGLGGGVGTGGLSGGGGGGLGAGGLGSSGGAPGMVGGIGGTGGGTAKGGSAAKGGAGAGGAARGAGRTGGTPGMGGAAGAAGRGAGGKGAAGRGGPLARQKGGVVGGAGKKAGGGAQGGSGLHRSRGGTQQGAKEGRRPMAGAPGAHGGKGKDKDKNNGQRPDYLVEDEETWTTQRNVAPRVIE